MVLLNICENQKAIVKKMHIVFNFMVQLCLIPKAQLHM
jgi:hypothetical protein